MKESVKKALNKQIPAKAVVTIWLNLVIIVATSDPDVKSVLPTWVYVVLYTSMGILSVLFNVEIPGFTKIIDQIRQIVTDTTITPLDKLNQIELLLPQLTGLWDRINQSKPRDEGNDEEGSP